MLTPAADEDQSLLLFCDQVTTKLGRPMPWDDIAAEFEPRDLARGRKPLTGEAVKQHLTKLRKHRVAHGFRVPPALGRNDRRHAASIQAGRYAAALPSPTPTPKKKSSGSAAASKPSTLLATVSKTKQRKADKAKKAAAGEVVEPVSAKRGRKSPTEPLNRESSSYRRPNTLNDAQVSRRTYKYESETEEDDDDLLLSKKSRTNNDDVGLMSDTLAIWSDRDNVGSQIVASPLPQDGGIGSLAFPGTIPGQNETAGWQHPNNSDDIMPSQSEATEWSYTNTFDNTGRSIYPTGDPLVNPFAMTPELLNSFAGLPSFPSLPSFGSYSAGYDYSLPSQNMSMMPMRGPTQLLSQMYTALPQQTATEPSTSFVPSSVTYSSQTPMDYQTPVDWDHTPVDYSQTPVGYTQTSVDYSQFVNEEHDETDFDAPPDSFPDTYGANYGPN